MNDPMDITADDCPYDRVRLGEAGAESIRKEVRVSYVMADQEAAWKAALAEAKHAVVQRMAKQFTAAMREEGLPEESVRRVLNRVLTGHPDGLEHWSREVERAAERMEGRFTDVEEDQA